MPAPFPTPDRTQRRRRRSYLNAEGQPEVQSEAPAIERTVEVVTPILGGGVRLRHVDDAQPIRAASIRGQLRFWWRALFSHRYDSPDAQFAAERIRWGGLEGTIVTPSRIRVRVSGVERTAVDRTDMSYRDPLAYALWPARAESRSNKPPAERWRAGLRFRLQVQVVELPDAVLHEEVRAAVDAWLLFGGYGARTRRGVGALRDTGASELPPARDLATWLSARLEPGAVFGSPLRPATETPRLDGARLAATSPQRTAEKAVDAALEQLKAFRQGAPRTTLGARDPAFARNGGEVPGDRRASRPSISNWPEPDKLRHVLMDARRSTHVPRHNAVPAWPRASFGLPIPIHWSRRGRKGDRYVEPNDCVLVWATEDGRKLKDRLASPLLITCLETRDGWVGVLLWMTRAFPEDGVVGVEDRVEKRLISASRAPFDVPVARGDSAHYTPLADADGTPADGRRVERAFFSWLATQRGVEVLA